jgi:predicted ABC-type ATPase
MNLRCMLVFQWSWHFARKTDTIDLIIFIRGVPGSGKTYLTAELLKSLEDTQVVVLDPDLIDFGSKAYQEHALAQRAEGVDEQLIPYRYLRAQAYQAIADHKIIIWNQPFTDLNAFEKITARLKESADERNTTLPILVVEVETDRDVAWQRVQDRMQAGGHGPSDNTLNRRMDEYDTAAPHGYTVVAVFGQQDVSKSASTVLENLSKLAA